MYGNVTKVVHGYYKEAKFKQVKTGRRLVFIELFEGSHPPPFCIVRGQKISVSYRGRRSLCYHCNVEGHIKMHCPVAWFKACYNCGSPDHESIQCWEPTLVAFFFEEDRQNHPSCYPTNYRSEDPADDLDYGLIQNINEARDYHYTFNSFYTREAADSYKRDTYKEDSQDKQDDKDEDENEEDDDIMEGIWGTPIHRNAKQREDTTSAKQDTAPHAKTNTNSTAPSSKDTSKTSTTNDAKKTQPAPQKNDDKPVPKPRTAKTPETKTGPTTTDQKADNDDKSTEQPSSNKSTEQPAPVKRKLATNSPQKDEGY